jgi:hypothetical protein
LLTLFTLAFLFQFLWSLSFSNIVSILSISELLMIGHGQIGQERLNDEVGNCYRQRVKYCSWHIKLWMLVKFQSQRACRIRNVTAKAEFEF